MIHLIAFLERRQGRGREKCFFIEYELKYTLIKMANKYMKNTQGNAK
jgi:hypothetical protein